MLLLLKHGTNAINFAQALKIMSQWELQFITLMKPANYLAAILAQNLSLQWVSIIFKRLALNAGRLGVNTGLLNKKGFNYG